jgi:hypothetical protein
MIGLLGLIHPIIQLFYVFETLFSEERLDRIHPDENIRQHLTVAAIHAIVVVASCRCKPRFDLSF